jgi:hypothetical protein
MVTRRWRQGACPPVGSRSSRRTRTRSITLCMTRSSARRRSVMPCRHIAAGTVMGRGARRRCRRPAHASSPLRRLGRDCRADADLCSRGGHGQDHRSCCEHFSPGQGRFRWHDRHEKRFAVTASRVLLFPTVVHSHAEPVRPESTKSWSIPRPPTALRRPLCCAGVKVVACR